MSRLRDLFLPLVCLFALVGAMANASTRVAKAPTPHFAHLVDLAGEPADSDAPDPCGEETGGDVLFVNHASLRPTLVALGDFLLAESALFVHYPPALERPPRLARTRA